ncbi:MAG: hypothetical protein ACE5GN_02015 [Waddliaceae bacterium]
MECRAALLDSLESLLKTTQDGSIPGLGGGGEILSGGGTGTLTGRGAETLTEAGAETLTLITQI